MKNIYYLKNYTNNGLHIGYYTDLPCRIEKGRDEFINKKKWYVIFEPHINIPDATYGEIECAKVGARNKYKKYLEDTLKKIQEGKIKWKQYG